MRFAGGVTALDGVSFEARPGQVLGFLGPNGAGKTTAMRICTGFLAPTSGRVTIGDIDVASDPLAARARLGYLPESVPLYPEMRVDEYLAYRAALKGVPSRQRRARIDDAIASVAIGPERRRVIGQLSKGYRQRVGLADALLHAPDVLILDEPTDGLDPNQRRDVLDLIGRLGQDRAVILSTHILPEVESVCARVVILDRGRVIAEGTPTELVAPDRDLVIVARGDREPIAAALRAVPGVLSVEIDDKSDGEPARKRDSEAAGKRDSEPARKRESEAARKSDDEAARKSESEAAREGESEPAGKSDGKVTRDTSAAHYRVRTDRDVREALARAVLSVGELRELRAAAAGLERVFATLTGRA
jgi:ABC-2 type transport system ATP-binding protein